MNRQAAAADNILLRIQIILRIHRSGDAAAAQIRVHTAVSAAAPRTAQLRRIQLFIGKIRNLLPQYRFLVCTVSRIKPDLRLIRLAVGCTFHRPQHAVHLPADRPDLTDCVLRLFMQAALNRAHLALQCLQRCIQLIRRAADLAADSRDRQLSCAKQLSCTLHFSKQISGRTGQTLQAAVQL